MNKFLVILDDSRECLNAMRLAARGAPRRQAGHAGSRGNPPEEFQHWIGAAEVMREEARERSHARTKVFAKWIRDRQNVDPELVIREGEAVPEILSQIEEDGGFRLPVLGASPDEGGPEPIVKALSQRLGALSVPLAIVPGGLSNEQLSEIR